MARIKPWILRKVILPQHTDYAGVMWHGSYLNLLEEARIKALKSSGIEYITLVNKGFELPLLDLNIKYISPIFMGDEIDIETIFSISNSPKINIVTKFSNKGLILTKAVINIVLIDSKNFKIVRKRPSFLLNVFDRLKKGPIN